ncbi:uncharacterized protein MYCFIDRAFT_210632 [Pseudocercospora fijiensis CIRAD86]|uniref:Uncharacterized protein n=1 Tax=Pseudocercospora fijiensis (strain CIRAD86) TaxID=383855 RepID=M2ZAL3_PSEFD|nr:uncharacterized protein MYCFIDRAFT_210632 [Pseudocercospora fijiensis CIRAD86]EME86855.1 hypothetical protein MYCFIDRAFT_210632 [Pseudocercospora fijiensis CIRAD86]
MKLRGVSKWRKPYPLEPPSNLNHEHGNTSSGGSVQVCCQDKSASNQVSASFAWSREDLNNTHDDVPNMIMFLAARLALIAASSGLLCELLASPRYPHSPTAQLYNLTATAAATPAATLCRRDSTDPIPRIAKMQLWKAPKQDHDDRFEAYLHFNVT